MPESYWPSAEQTCGRSCKTKKHILLKILLGNKKLTLAAIKLCISRGKYTVRAVTFYDPITCFSSVEEFGLSEILS